MILTRLDLPDFLEQEVASLTAMKQRHQQEMDADLAKAGSADSSALSQTSTQGQREHSQPTNVITINSQSQGGVAVDAAQCQEEVEEPSTSRASQLQLAGNQPTTASQRESRSSTIATSTFSTADDDNDGCDDNRSSVWPAASSRNGPVSLGNADDVQSTSSRPDSAPGSSDDFSHHQLDDLETSALSDLFDDSTHEVFAKPLTNRSSSTGADSVSGFSSAKKVNLRFGGHSMSSTTASRQSEDPAADGRNADNQQRPNPDNQQRPFSVPSQPHVDNSLLSDTHQPTPDSCISQTILNRISRKEFHHRLHPQDSDSCQFSTTGDLLDSIDKEHAGKLICVKKNSKVSSESSRRLASRLKDKLNGFVRNSLPVRLSHCSRGGGDCETSSAQEGIDRTVTVESRSPSVERSKQEKQPNRVKTYSASSKEQQPVISDEGNDVGDDHDGDDSNAREEEYVLKKQKKQSSDRSRRKPKLTEKEKPRNEELEASTDISFSFTRRTSEESTSQHSCHGSSLSKNAKHSHSSPSARRSSSELNDSMAGPSCSETTPTSKVSHNTLSRLKQFSFSSSAEESPSDIKNQRYGQQTGQTTAHNSSTGDQNQPTSNSMMHESEPDAGACVQIANTRSMDQQQVTLPGQRSVCQLDPSNGPLETKGKEKSTPHGRGPKHTENRTFSTETKAAGEVQRTFFQLPDDSDEDLDDSFSGTSAKKRKCFQLANDSDNDTEDQNKAAKKLGHRKTGVSDSVRAIPDSQTSIPSSQSSVQGDFNRANGKHLLKNNLKNKLNKGPERCETPNHLLQSQDSLTLSQSLQNQAKDTDQGHTVARQLRLPTIGGTPSNSQSNFVSSTPIVSNQNETGIPFLNDLNMNRFKTESDSAVSNKNSNSAGKTTPAWLMKLNSQRKCPTSASTVSSSLSLASASPFQTVDDDDLDLDLDFDQPFKKQRKS